MHLFSVVSRCICLTQEPTRVLVLKRLVFPAFLDLLPLVRTVAQCVLFSCLKCRSWDCSMFPVSPWKLCQLARSSAVHTLSSGILSRCAALPLVAALITFVLFFFALAASLGQSTCTPCQPGTAQPTAGQVSCPFCASGRFTNSSQTGMQNCQLCPAGTRAQH